MKDDFTGLNITLSDPRTKHRYMASITAVKGWTNMKLKVGGPWFKPTLEEVKSIVDSRVGPECRCCE